MENHKEVMHRTLIEVYSLNKKGFKIMSPGWNPRKRFTINHDCFGDKHKAAIIEGLLEGKEVFFFVETNIGADLVTDLKFRNFELAPEPKYKTLEEYFTKE